MSEEKTTGMDRRTVLRRGALLGGALVWSTPVVQSLGGTALAATGTPAGGGQTPGDGYPSYVFIWYKCSDGMTYSVKYGKISNGSFTATGGATEQLLSDDVVPGKQGKKESDADYAARTMYSKQAYDAFKALYGANAPYQSGVPGDVTVVAANGNLAVTLGAGCQITGWFLHDGSCQLAPAGYDDPKSRWSGTPSTSPDYNEAGPLAPTTAPGTFYFDKC